MTKLPLLIGALAAALTVTPAMPAEDAGTIKNAKGTVTIQRGSEKIAAKPGAGVATADRIVTGADGSVGIILRDNTLLSAGPNSTVVLERFAFDSTTHAGELDASLKRGTLAVVSGKIAKQSPGAVQFRTPNAILGVRGTEFVIDAGAGEE
jgi:hypothetical protein